MKEIFGQLETQERISTYFEILKGHEEILTIKQLEQKVANIYQNDNSVNYSRIQRDIQKFIEENKIEDLNSLKALRWYVNNFYLSDNINQIKNDIVKMSYDKTCLNIYIGTKNGCAERIGQFIRESLNNFEPYVIADFDTLWIHLRSNQQFDEFIKIITTNFNNINPNLE